MAAGIEVAFEPDVHSSSCYAILGCDRMASSEKLKKAYRDLSRKYHPDSHPNNEEARYTFQRIFVAYSIILESPSSQHVPFDDDAMGNATLDDAKLAYARAFGEFRDRYYSKGAIIGLPYSYQLRESLERSRCIREAFSFTICRFQVSLFRSFFIKKELGAMFLFLETMCTWGAIILAVWNFLLEEFPDALEEIPYVRDLDVEEIPHVSIIGGVAVLIGNFIQSFWYGFTRHPIIVDKNYGTWLLDGNTSTGGEICDIQDTCSSVFHSDSYQRSHIFTLFACTPLLVVDHAASVIASIPVFLFFLCKTGKARRQSSESELAYQFSKSIGALMSIVGYYLLWVLGGNYSKVVVAAALLLNQHLYNALLFRKSFGGFLQSLLFGSIFTITILYEQRKDRIKAEDETATSDIERGLIGGRKFPIHFATEAESDTQPQCPSDEVGDTDEPSDADPDVFEANFDGFYRTQSKSSTARSITSVPPLLLSSDENFATKTETVDYRGRKSHNKPLPSWYQKRDAILDTQTKAYDVNRTTSFANMFQCATDTVDDYREESQKANTASSVATGRNTAVETTHTTQTPKTETTETTDMIALARSAKRKLEAEFYARVFGTPSAAQSTSGRRTDNAARRSYGAKQVPDTLSPGVPEEIKMDIPPVFTPMFDDSSGESSRGRQSTVRSEPDSRFTPMQSATLPKNAAAPSEVIDEERPKELDDVLGPFMPFTKSATTRTTPTYSIGASHVTGTSHGTRKKSNARTAASRLSTQASKDFIIHHHPNQGPSAYGEVEGDLSPRRSRSVGSVPGLVIGAQGSADESEVTMDRRQFKRDAEKNYFWQFMANPTGSTLTRSVT